MKATNAVPDAANPPIPAQLPPPLPPPGSPHTVKTTNLSSIISYSSPSPPSTPTTTTTPAESKWKRVASALPAAAVIASDAPRPSPMVVDDNQRSTRYVAVSSEGSQAGSPAVRDSKKPHGEF